MQHKFPRILLGLFALTVCIFPGCVDASKTIGGNQTFASQNSQGSLEVRVLTNTANLFRTFANVENIDHLTISVSIPGMGTRTKEVLKSDLTNNSTSYTTTFGNLIVGTATIKVSIYDQENLLIGSGSQTASITSGQTTVADISIQLIPNLSNTLFSAGVLTANISISNGLSLVNSGTVSTLAGHGVAGFDNGTGVNASFRGVFYLFVDSNGDVYVPDCHNHVIRKITATGLVSTFSGSGVEGFQNGASASAQFDYPNCITKDNAGNFYVADGGNLKVRKITADGTVSTFAGAGTLGDQDGPAGVAQFRSLDGICADPSGNLYVTEYDSNRIRKITPSGVVSTFAGGSLGTQDGTGTSAKFNSPKGIASDSAGNLFVVDRGNNRIRKITQSGVVTTLAGSTAGYRDDTGSNAQFKDPLGIAVDSNGAIYVADCSNNCIRKVSRTGTVTTIAGQVTGGFTNAVGPAAQFLGPCGIAVDKSGAIYIGDVSNYSIRKIM